MDPSGWRVPVLVSNFSQETVMVEPFSEVGMIAQVSAIQLVIMYTYISLKQYPIQIPHKVKIMHTR